MIIERRITFIIGIEGFAAWKLSRLNTLASYFRSIIIVKNISTGHDANTEHALQVISLGSQQNQLCQLWIEGADAELACMVLTDFIADQFEIVNTSHKKTEELSYSIIDNHSAFVLPFTLLYHHKMRQSIDFINKDAIISTLSSMLNAQAAQVIFHSLLKREAISPTSIGNGIALPHVMVKEVTQPALAIIKLDNPIDWRSALGDVDTIISILIPASADIAVLKACTQLSRNLLNPNFCSLLRSTKEPEALKAILFHSMTPHFIRIR